MSKRGWVGDFYPLYETNLGRMCVCERGWKLGELVRESVRNWRERGKLWNPCKKHFQLGDLFVVKGF